SATSSLSILYAEEYKGPRNNMSQIQDKTPNTPNVDEKQLQPVPYNLVPYAMPYGQAPGAMQQGGYPQMGQFYPGMPNFAHQPGVPLVATPIAALNRASAPVDCPVCGIRDLTATRKSGPLHGIPSMPASSQPDTLGDINKSHLEASLPPTELKQEKLTKVTYDGPPKVIGGVGRPDSVHSPTKELPGAPSSSQQQRQGSQYTPNEKQPLLQSFQQDPNVTPIGALGRNSAIIKCPLCNQCDPTNTRLLARKSPYRLSEIGVAGGKARRLTARTFASCDPGEDTLTEHPQLHGWATDPTPSLLLAPRFQPIWAKPSCDATGRVPAAGTDDDAANDDATDGGSNGETHQCTHASTCTRRLP
ncbi:5267_t:CDS:2, partial [Acaulospora colombiana]